MLASGSTAGRLDQGRTELVEWESMLRSVTLMFA